MRSEPRGGGEVMVGVTKEVSLLASLCVFVLAGGGKEKERRCKLSV